MGSNATAQALFDAGIQLRDQGKVQASLAKFQHALQVEPNFAPALDGLGDIHALQGRSLEALSCYQSLLKYHPRRRARVAIKVASIAEQAGQLWIALDACLLALADGHQDEHAEALRETAWNLIYRNAGRLLDDVASTELPVGLLQQPADFFKRLGDTARAANDTRLALSAYRRALQHADQTPAIDRAIGETLAQIGQSREARQYFERALQAFPFDGIALHALGLDALHHDEFEAAAGYGSKIDQACVDSGSALLFAATAARASGDLGAISGRFRAAFGLDRQQPDHPATQWHMGLRLSRLREAQLIPPQADNHSVQSVSAGVASVDVVPEYAHLLRLDQGVDPKIATDLDALERVEPPQNMLNGVTLYGGYFLDHFGHFVAECPHRLWAWDFHQEEISQVAILANRRGHPGTQGAGDLGFDALRPYQQAVVEYMGIPADRIVVVTAPSTAETLLVPEPGSFLNGADHVPRGYLQWLAGRQRSFFSSYEPAQASYPDKLFVSRPHLVHQGGIPGEHYLESLLAEEGFCLFRPEQHSVFEQMNHYRHASEMIFSEGSALHGLELLGILEHQPRIAILHRRPPDRHIWESLVRSRTPHGAFYSSTLELPSLGANAFRRMRAHRLAMISDTEELIAFLREATSARLDGFDQDAFAQQEAADVARYLLQVPLPTPGAEKLWSYFGEFRDRILSISNNPYLTGRLN